MKWLKNWFKIKDATSQEDKLAHAKSLFHKGFGAYNKGQFRIARDTFAACLSEYQGLIAEGREELRPKLAGMRMKYGSCLRNLGDLPKARRAYEDTLEEFQGLIAEGREELRLNLAITRMNYGLCLWNLGDLPKARRAYEETLEEFQGLIAEGHEELWQYLALTRMNYGNCLSSLGDLPKARRAYKDTLAEYESLIAEGCEELRPDLARTRMNYGACLYSLGDLPKARRAYEETLEDQGLMWPDLALMRMNYGLCLWNLGDLPKARRAYEDTLEEYQGLIAEEREESRPELARTRMNYGNCLSDLGDLPKARRAYEDTLEEYQRLIAEGREESRPDLARTRMNYGNCLSDLGDLPKARRAYEETLEEYQRLIAEGREELRPDLASTRYNLALCLEEIGDYVATETQYQTSFSYLENLHKIGQLFPDAIKMVRVIADWYRNPQRPNGADKPGALNLATQGLDWLDTLLNRISDAAKNFLLEQNLPLFHLATDLALELNQPASAYSILERSKSRVLVEQMLREVVEPGPQVTANLRQQYQKLRQDLRQLVHNLGTPTTIASSDNGPTRFLAPSTSMANLTPEQEQQLLQKQQDIESELQKVRTAIAAQDSAFGEAIQPHPLTTADIASILPPHVLAIAFEQRPNFLYLYAITAQTIHAPLRAEITATQLSERIEQFQEDVNSKICERAVTEMGAWLTQQLGTTIAQLLKEGQSELLLIPHQAWHLLPLHLIQIDGEPLVLRYPTRYIPALQVLRLIHARPPAQQNAGCIVANPWGEYPISLQAKKLPNAETEGRTIYKLRGEIDKLFPLEKATLPAVRKTLDNAQHGHFSCHGYFAPNLNAGLILADGSLQAKELFAQIRLPNPRLIILSACETAQIETTLGDEYMGLPASFLFAGAHNVLAALWRVDDASTRLLMEDFYYSIAKGATPTLALQQAQRQLRDMPREVVQKRLQSKKEGPKIPYQNPYYWAGFVLVGDGN
jgi:CHAT domain-containing protein